MAQQAFQCNSSGIYVGTTKCQLSPLEPGKYLIPGGATLIAPPTYNSATQAAQFNFASKSWSVIPLAPKNLSYGAPGFNFAISTAATPISPTVSGGQIASYGVSPALPPGLNLDSTTGIISGTPTVAQNPAFYTVTASNTAGSSSAALVISVIVAVTKPA
jgi:hypothetical protein